MASVQLLVGILKSNKNETLCMQARDVLVYTSATMADSESQNRHMIRDCQLKM